MKLSIKKTWDTVFTNVDIATKFDLRIFYSSFSLKRGKKTRAMNTTWMTTGIKTISKLHLTGMDSHDPKL
jgi:hypothetical protein